MSSIFYDPIGWFQLLLIVCILYFGTKQYLMARSDHAVNKSYVIPLGALCLIFGLLGLFIHMRQAFRAIEIVGDLSPQIIAGSIKNAYNFPIVGLIGLGISYAFRFVSSSLSN